MHQQVRTDTTKTDAPGAAWADSGSVVDILRILSDAGVNLQAAGGRDLDRGGEFVFAVYHDGEDEGPAEEAAKLLRENGYGTARVVSARSCFVEDEPGGLLGCVEEMERTDGPVYEIFVGTPEEGRGVPVQITTRKDVEGEAAS
jgi:hypothetical protein